MAGGLFLTRAPGQPCLPRQMPIFNVLLGGSAMQTLGFQRLDFFGCGFLSRSDLEWLDAWDPPEWLYSEPDAEAWVRAFWVVLACPKLLQSPRGASPAADHGAWGPRSCLLHLVPTSFLGRVCSCWVFLQNFTACVGRVRSSVGRLARPSGPRCREPSREARKSLAILAGFRFAQRRAAKDSNSVSWSEFKDAVIRV